MDLKTKLDADMKSAMKKKDKERLSVIRMVLSDIKNQEIKQGGPLEEDAILSLLSKSVKQRKDSITQFREGGREDLADKETRELECLAEYLPIQLSADELGEIIDNAITTSGAASLKELGLVMKMVMSEAAGRADGKEVQQMVRDRLS